MSQKPKSDAILECYRRATEARRLGDAATNPLEKADFLEVAERWLTLARSPQLWSHTGTRNPDEVSDSGKKKPRTARGIGG
jgi:hypothetical protein